MTAPRVLVVDHRDSFVFILAEQFLRLGAELRTYRSDMELGALQEIVGEFAPDLVVLSPGPGRPETAGVTVPWLRTRPQVPVLGICLGHQALGVAAGGTVERAPEPVHGRPWSVDVEDPADPLFAGMPARFAAARYHSLVVTEPTGEYRVLATALDSGSRLVMAMRHRELPWVGLQFHPESVLTPRGGVLIERALATARKETR